MESTQTVNIIFVGRTGSGKSSLCNKIAGRTLFREGHNLFSETEGVSSEVINWPSALQIKVKLIDCPGFGDNRPEMTNEVLFSRILTFIQSLKDGLNIVLFCTNSRSRFDAHDSLELEMLGLLLGEQLYDHVYIVLTQVNNLVVEERPRLITRFMYQLPSILESQGFPSIPEERILVSDFDNFDKFMTPLTREIQTQESFVPEIADGVDAKDPESIARFLQSPEMKKVMQKYEEIIEAKKNQIIKIEETLLNKTKEMEEQIQEYQMRNQQVQVELSKVNDLLKNQQYTNEQTKKELEASQQLYRQQINEFNKIIENAKITDAHTKRLIKAKEKQIQELIGKIDQINRVQSQPEIRYIERSGGCWPF